MTHPFKDKIFVFIGTPKRCDRQAARDALISAGGIPDERITAFTDYVVAFNHNSKTKIYQKALEYERRSLLMLVDEEQFFDILEGKSEPPEKPKQNEDIIVIPAKDPEAAAREFEQIEKNIKTRKRLKNLAKYGVPTPDGGREKINLRPLDTVVRVTKRMKEKSNE